MQHASQSILRTHITGTMSEEERDNAARETIRAMRQDPISNAIWDIRGAKLAYSLIGSHLVVLDLPCLGARAMASHGSRLARAQSNGAGMKERNAGSGRDQSQM
jgi:hypothetical protein